MAAAVGTTVIQQTQLEQAAATNIQHDQQIWRGATKWIGEQTSVQSCEQIRGEAREKQHRASGRKVGMKAAGAMSAQAMQRMEEEFMIRGLTSECRRVPPPAPNERRRSPSSAPLHGLPPKRLRKLREASRLTAERLQGRWTI